MSNLEDRLRQLEKEISGKLRQLPPLIGEEVINFSLDNFEQEAWIDQGATP